MKLFRDLTDNEEEMMDFKKKMEDDDIKIKQYLDQCNHQDFSFAIMHIGVLLDTIATYFDFLQPKMALAIGDVERRSRRINKYLNDLNVKINNEYDFDDEVVIVEEGVLYDNHVYLFINKSRFIKVMQLKEL